MGVEVLTQVAEVLKTMSGDVSTAFIVYVLAQSLIPFMTNCAWALTAYGVVRLVISGVDKGLIK